jgi:hypothetical protein
MDPFVLEEDAAVDAAYLEDTARSFGRRQGWSSSDSWPLAAAVAEDGILAQKGLHLLLLHR